MHFVIHMLWWTSQNFPSDWYLCITKIKKITLKANTWWNTHFDMLWGLWWVISTSFHSLTHLIVEDGSEQELKAIFKMDYPTIERNMSSCEPHLLMQGIVNKVIRDFNLSKKKKRAFGLYSFRKILKYVCFVTTKKKFKICILKKNI